jgi:hypothetical protein
MSPELFRPEASMLVEPEAAFGSDSEPISATTHPHNLSF